jgi:hypothetical protein
MKTYLDQREIGPQPTLAAALETARRQAADLGRVVVEVKLDGVDLTDEQIDQPGTVAGERIECISADPRALVAMSFEQAAEALDEARAIQQDAAGALQAGQTDQAFGLLAEAVGVWEAVRKVLDQAPVLLGVSPQSLCPAGTSFQQTTAELSASLSALKATLAMQDWATLADLLNAELDQQAEVWTGLLGQMGQAARVLASPGVGESQSKAEGGAA